MRAHRLKSRPPFFQDKHIIRPYLIAILGILADWITTSIGLMNPYRFPGLVLYETNSHYSPLWGLLIFLTALTIFVKIQKNPPGKGALFWRYLISFVPWIGPINNILVLLGVWRGLIYLFS